MSQSNGNQKPSTGKQLANMMHNNRQAIIAKKESWYDKLISSCHLTAKSMNIIIVILIALGVLVFVIGYLNRK